MGVGEVADLSDSYRTQNVQESVSGWLFSECREFYNLDKPQEHSWLLPQYKHKKDADQSSVASVDDIVSVSDSAHESYSSESSGHTAWTSATDPADIFLDEEERERLQQFKLSQANNTALELQEHLLKGLHAKDQSNSTSAPSCMVKNAYHSIKARVVPSQFQPHTADQSQKLPTCQPSSSDPIRKCNGRRSGLAGQIQSSPPKLKRDTETTDQFVSLLIIFATRLITAIWPLSASPPMMSTCFNGAGVLPLRVFIQETLRRSKTSYSTLQVALYYLVMLKAKLPSGEVTREQPRAPANSETPERSQCRAMQCGRRMFLSALMLASKYLQDRNYSARAWSKISGLRSNEINENEREYLAHIDYNLHIPKETFDNWSKLVLALSKLSREAPQSRSDCISDSYRPEGGASLVLANMVSQVDLDRTVGQHTFSDEWWCDLIQKLDPSLAKESGLVDDFIRTNLPRNVDPAEGAFYLNKQSWKPWDTQTVPVEALTQVYDINFSDNLKQRSAVDQSKPQTPQIPAQLSPSRGVGSGMPRQPHLRNLPTPQSTPQIPQGCQWKPALRCAASMDALRSMRKQCIMNANLDRCPPPRPQGYSLPPMKSLIRPAETIQEIPSRCTTPSTSSPGSVTSDSTAYTSRSRSSSISSNSSWSSTMPRSRFPAGMQFSSPLSRVSSNSDRYYQQASTGQRFDMARFNDEGYGSSEEPHVRLSKHCLSTSSEAAAIQGLLSLSSQSESTSQSVTPTPQRYAEDSYSASNESSRGHKRSLSKTDYALQSQVRNTLLGDAMSIDVAEDTLQPFYDLAPKQWQLPTKGWAAPRRALPNTADNKRVATYCSIQQFASAPDLASQYLKDSMITAS